MSVIPSSVWDHYNTMGDLIINEVNATSLTLYFSDEVANDVALDPNVPSNIDVYGGRSPVDSWIDKSQEAGQGYSQTTRTETITVRLYWANHNIYDDSKKAMLFDSKNRAKINAFASDMQRMMNAKYAIVQNQGRNIRLKMSVPPVPYGLHQKRYCVSYWEEING